MVRTPFFLICAKSILAMEIDGTDPFEQAKSSSAPNTKIKYLTLTILKTVMFYGRNWIKF
jgi:hypothetical protein